MSLCQEAYRRGVSVALVLALVLIALPSMLNAQTAAPNAPTVQSSDTVPKVDLFLGYQWLNPGGNTPDLSSPPVAMKVPSLAKGFGASADYNFNRIVAAEVSWGVNWNSNYRINTVVGGPKFT